MNKYYFYRLLLFFIPLFLATGCLSPSVKKTQSHPIFTAIKNNNLEVVVYYIEHNVNTEIKNSYGLTPLLASSMYGNIEISKYLIEQGANINYTYNEKFTTYPLYELITNGYKSTQEQKYLDLVKYFVEHGANYKKIGFNNYTLIHASQSVRITKYLSELGLDIHSLSSNNASTLLALMLNNKAQENISLLTYLINHCVDPTTTALFGNDSVTAYDMALVFKKTVSAKLILNAINNPPKQCLNTKALAPILSFYNLPETFDSENVNISIQIKAQGFGVGDIHIFVNGSEVKNNKKRALKKKRAEMNVKSFNLKLQKGLNELKVYAYDQSNTVRSKTIYHDVIANYTLNTKPTLHAVVIGIDRFKDNSLNLKFAEADASLFGTTLFKRARTLFKHVDIIYLKKEEETTKEAILAKLASLNNISANDFFVFYVATHGIKIDNTYYLITSNIASQQQNYIKEQALSDKELLKAFKLIPTANKLFLFDTCYAGSINKNISKKLSASVKNLNITSIAAASSIQTALEGYADGHGIFTYVLSDALEGDADINNDGVVQSMELVNYTKRVVPVEALAYNHVQTPAYFQAGQVFNLTKLRRFKGPVAMQPQYFQPNEIKKLINHMNHNEVTALNKIILNNKKATKEKIKHIKQNAAIVEARNSENTFKTADIKFNMGKFSFIFNDNSVFLNIKDKLKGHDSFTDSMGRHLVYFDFYSNKEIPHTINKIQTEKISKIYIAKHTKFYRVTLDTKTLQSYEYVINESGFYLKLKDKQLR